jgi:hypothetical protein
MAIAATANPIAILLSMMLNSPYSEHPSLCESNSAIVIGLQDVVPLQEPGRSPTVTLTRLARVAVRYRD